MSDLIPTQARWPFSSCQHSCSYHHVRDWTDKQIPLKYNVFFIILLCGLLPYVALLPDVHGEVHTANLALSCFLKPQCSLLHCLLDFCLRPVQQLLLVTQVLTHVPGYPLASPQR